MIELLAKGPGGGRTLPLHKHLADTAQAARLLFRADTRWATSFLRFFKIPEADRERFLLHLRVAAYFHDIAVPRIGGEYVFGVGRRRWAARAGYVFEPSPAPVQRGSTNLIDNDKHTLSAGLGVELPGLGGVVLRPVSIDLALAVTDRKSVV